MAPKTAMILACPLAIVLSTTVAPHADRQRLQVVAKAAARVLGVDVLSSIATEDGLRFLPR